MKKSKVTINTGKKTNYGSAQDQRDQGYTAVPESNDPQEPGLGSRMVSTFAGMFTRKGSTSIGNKDLTVGLTGGKQLR